MIKRVLLGTMLSFLAVESLGNTGQFENKTFSEILTSPQLSELAVQEGKRIFLGSSACANCHGQDGRGTIIPS